MTRLASAVLLCVWLAQGLDAQVKLPESVSGRAGRLIIIQAESKAKQQILWWSFDAKKEQDKADLFILGPDRAGFVAAQPGRYLVLAVV